MSVSEHARPRIRFYEPSGLMRALTRLGNAVAMRPLLRSGWGRRHEDLCILEVAGRRSGRTYRVPVQIHRLGDEVMILTASGWRVNLRGGADVTLTWGGERRPWRATLVEDREEVARVYERLLAEVGIEHAKRLGLRIEGAWPTHDDLAAALDARRCAVVLATTDAAG